MSTPITESFDQRWPARPEVLREVRQSVGAFATQHGVAPDLVRSVALAVSEATTNVIVHAYPDGAGDVAVRARVEREMLLVWVRDWGSGMTPRPDSPGIGLGLPVIAQLAQSFTVSAAPDDEGGTEVCMCFSLAAPQGY